MVELFFPAFPYLKQLGTIKNDALDIQLKVFEEHKEEDMLEFSHRLEDIKSELEYPLQGHTLDVQRPTSPLFSLHSKNKPNNMNE